MNKKYKTNKCSGQICPKRLFKVGLIPVMLELYDNILPELRGMLAEFWMDLQRGLGSESIEIISSEIVCNNDQMLRACNSIAKLNVDSAFIVNLCYAASGQIVPSLVKFDVPFVLWPAQPLSKLIPAQYSSNTVLMNHACHGLMDLANVLGRKGKNFGILHGHWQDLKFRCNFEEWIKAGCIIKSMKQSNPLVLGNRFEDMLDLRLDDEKFIKDFKVKAKYIRVSEFASLSQNISTKKVKERVAAYYDIFSISKDLERCLLEKTARHELALRQLLINHSSTAFGINFVEVCNNSKVEDALHVSANLMMSEGKGYAGEGDWETAMFMYGLQQAFGPNLVSFTEIFTPGYKDNRLVLKHWGEGNIALARKKPSLATSEFNDTRHSKFLICQFEFKPGKATLFNLTSNRNKQGQILAIEGNIEPDGLPKCDGVRAVFKHANCVDISELLTKYSILGGSHHMVLVTGETGGVAEKMASLNGWTYIKL